MSNYGYELSEIKAMENRISELKKVESMFKEYIDAVKVEDFSEMERIEDFVRKHTMGNGEIRLSFDSVQLRKDYSSLPDEMKEMVEAEAIMDAISYVSQYNGDMVTMKYYIEPEYECCLDEYTTLYKALEGAYSDSCCKDATCIVVAIENGNGECIDTYAIHSIER